MTAAAISASVELGKETARMIIEITSPDVEALIHQRMQTGAFNSLEDVVRAALRLSGPDAKPAENASVESCLSRKPSRNVGALLKRSVN